MTSVNKQLTSSIPEIKLEDLDFSILVGNEIVIFSEQIAGQPLKSRVILVNNRVISVDRSGNAGRIDSLVNNQTVTLRFDYKSEPVTIRGTLKRSQGGNCNIVLDEKAKPLAQRRFERFELTVSVKMARLTINSFDKSKIAKLRWLQTETSNISAGGLLLELAGFMESESYLVLNMNLGEVKCPLLILGQVRYCLQAAKTRYRTGIEFVTKEMSEKRFGAEFIRKLPHVVMEYDEKTRVDFGKCLPNIVNSNS